LVCGFLWVSLVVAVSWCWVPRVLLFVLVFFFFFLFFCFFILFVRFLYARGCLRFLDITYKKNILLLLLGILVILFSKSDINNMLVGW
jgi:hypothetical protein